MKKNILLPLLLSAFIGLISCNSPKKNDIALKLYYRYNKIANTDADVVKMSINSNAKDINIDWGDNSQPQTNNDSDMYEHTYQNGISEKTIYEITISGSINTINLQDLNDPYDCLYTIGNSFIEKVVLCKDLLSPEQKSTLGGGKGDYTSIIRNVIIEDGVKYIPNSIFSDTLSLNDIYFPCSVNKIYDGAFLDSNLETITFASDSKLEYIEKEAFSLCVYLQVCKLPNNLKTIGEQAFYNSTSMRYFSIPGSVQNIGEKAFYNTGKEYVQLSRVEFLGKVPPILNGKNVFPVYENLEREFVIYVPKDNLDVYLNNDSWKNQNPSIIKYIKSK